LKKKIADKEKILFVLNPISGKKDKSRLTRIIHREAELENYDYDLITTEGIGHATQLVTEHRENLHKVIAVGGDGTVNEVASAIRDTDKEMGIIPAGSGNGLARHLKIPIRTTDAMKLLVNGKTLKIDYGIANEKPFFCTFGIGFDAQIGWKFAKNETRGFSSYVRAVIKEFFSYKPKKYTIEIDGKKTVTRAFLITIANSGQYGNNAYISPEAKIDDGLLDICILKPFPKIAAFSLAFRLFTHTMHKSKYLTIIRGKQISMACKKKMKVHYDGEPLKLSKKLEIQVVPKGLNVITP
jgi:diacylglycerol kinase (ATP)